MPWHITDVIVPFGGLDLRLLDGYLPTYVAGLFNLVAGPILAYNLTFLTGAVLNVVAARALARRLSGSRLVHAVTAIAFLTAPPLALCVQSGLMPLFWAFPLPFLVADALDVVTGARDVRPLRLAGLLLLAFLCSVYFLVFGGLAYGVIVGVAAIRRRTWQIPVATAGALAIVTVALLPFIVPRFAFDRDEAKRGADTELLSDSELFSADALALVAPPTRATLLDPALLGVDDSVIRLPDPTHALEYTIFPGLVLLAGFVAYVCRPDTRRVPLATAAAATWILALGPSLKVRGSFVWEHAGKPVGWLPYRALLAIPGLGALRGPTRAGEVLVVLLAGATAIALSRLVTTSRARIAIGAACAALLATNLLLPLPTVTLGTSTATEAALHEIGRRAQKGDAVLSVPADCDPTFERFQVFHHAAVVGCAGSFAANPWSKMTGYARSDALAKLRCDRTRYGRLATRDTPPAPFGRDDVISLRQEFGVRFVVVNKRALFGCDAVNAAVQFLGGFASLGGDRDLEVLDLASLRS